MEQVKKQLIKKYGQDFAFAAMRNIDGCVNERVILKLSTLVGLRLSLCSSVSIWNPLDHGSVITWVQPPSAYLVTNYMKEIAKQFDVDWDPVELDVVDPLAPTPAPTGVTVASAAVSGPDFAALYAAVRDLHAR